jgi:hypothetical protein
MLKDKTGEVIDIGGGLVERDDWISVTGHGEVEKTADGEVLKYHGKTIKVPKGKEVGFNGTASSVHAFDWDGDGVIDLLVGDLSGNVWLIPNEGTKTEPAFGKHVQLTAGGKPIRVQGDAGPCVADWDGDGLPDLIVGAGDGSVKLFRNVGTRTKPVLAAGEILVPPAQWDGEHPPKEPRRGLRSKVCAVDWDGDGRLDLLVGDFANQKPDVPPPTPEQKAEADKLKAEYDALTTKYYVLSDKLGETKDDDARAKLKAELKEMRGKRSAMEEKLLPEVECHGWVWFFKRKPAGAMPK